MADAAAVLVDGPHHRRCAGEAWARRTGEHALRPLLDEVSEGDILRGVAPIPRGEGSVLKGHEVPVFVLVVPKIKDERRRVVMWRMCTLMREAQGQRSQTYCDGGDVSG